MNYDPDAVDKASEEGIGAAAAGVEPTLEPASPATESAEPAPELRRVGRADGDDPGARRRVRPGRGRRPDARARRRSRWRRPKTPDEAYDAVLEDAAAQSEGYRSDSTP